MSGRDQRPGAFHTEVLDVVEINADNRIAAHIAFEPENMDAAFAELDARYLAGEAAAHSHTWSVIAAAHSAVNRHEVPATTPDWIMRDHRPITTLEASDLPAFLDVTWSLMNIDLYVAAVHRLSDLGAVVTHTSHGTGQEGLEIEWRLLALFTVDGDMISRTELYDEADLDGAIARFEELHPQAPRLENAASRVNDRFFACFAAHNWAAIAETLADGSFIHDRRRVVNAGLWDGRDVVIANLQAVDEAGTNITSTVIATRGERLVLTRICSPNDDPRNGEFGVEMLGVAEIDNDERILAHVVFEPDEIDAAFTELDARYLAGEAAAHSHTWSVIARTNAGFNRHELHEVEWVTIDHRPLVTADTSDMPALFRSAWDLTPDLRTHIEAVHRLSSFGAVVTRMACGTSPDGFDAEWRMIHVLTVEGDRVDRCEIYDQANLDAALIRFGELHPQAGRRENAASQLIKRFQAHFAARNWAAIAQVSADDIVTDDRRSVVSSGILHGRDIDIANIRAIADLGATDLTSTVIATRAERLALARLRLSGRDQRPEAFHSELLGIVETDADDRVAARIVFDPDDLDTALAELDARYLAGEAAAHAHTWSVIMQGYAASNRHELPPTTQDWVNADHRHAIAFAPGDLVPYIRATWDVAPDINTYVETAHRLSNLGAVVTQVVRATSQQGFDGEWREVTLVTVEGDLINRIELFDEADLDAALAKLDELDTDQRKA